MPKSKRNKQVELSKTKQRGLEGKKRLVSEIRKCCENYQHLFIFSVNDMRNSKMKDVRQEWKHSRFFIGNNKIMAIALGRSREEEYKTNLYKISNKIVGQKGLLFSNQPVDEVMQWFSSYSRGDFARSGNVATANITLSEGPMSFPHSLESYLRQLGLPTTLKKGVVYLLKDYVVCKEGDILSPEMARILKLLGHQMAEFQIQIECVWSQDGSFQDMTLQSEENIRNPEPPKKKRKTMLEQGMESSHQNGGLKNTEAPHTENMSNDEDMEVEETVNAEKPATESSKNTIPDVKAQSNGHHIEDSMDIVENVGDNSSAVKDNHLNLKVVVAPSDSSIIKDAVVSSEGLEIENCPTVPDDSIVKAVEDKPKTVYSSVNKEDILNITKGKLEVDLVSPKKFSPKLTRSRAKSMSKNVSPENDEILLSDETPALPEEGRSSKESVEDTKITVSSDVKEKDISSKESKDILEKCTDVSNVQDIQVVTIEDEEDSSDSQVEVLDSICHEDVLNMVKMELEVHSKSPKKFSPKLTRSRAKSMSKKALSGDEADDTPAQMESIKNKIEDTASMEVAEESMPALVEKVPPPKELQTPLKKIVVSDISTSRNVEAECVEEKTFENNSSDIEDSEEEEDIPILIEPSQNELQNTRESNVSSSTEVHQDTTLDSVSKKDILKITKSKLEKVPNSPPKISPKLTRARSKATNQKVKTPDDKILMRSSKKSMKRKA